MVSVVSTVVGARLDALDLFFVFRTIGAPAVPVDAAAAAVAVAVAVVVCCSEDAFLTELSGTGENCWITDAG